MTARRESKADYGTPPFSRRAVWHQWAVVLACVTVVSVCGVSVGNAAVRGARQVVHYCNRDGCVDAPMDQYAYGISGLWPGYSHIPDSAQIPPGWTDLVTYHNYACSSSIPITISAELPGHPYGDATTVITVPALGAQTSGTLTFVMPNIGQHLTHGIFAPGVNFLESWGAWPTSDCRLNGRYWGAGLAWRRCRSSRSRRARARSGCKTPQSPSPPVPARRPCRPRARSV